MNMNHISLNTLIELLNNKSFSAFMYLNDNSSGCAMRFENATVKNDNETYFSILNNNRDNICIDIFSITGISGIESGYEIKTDNMRVVIELDMV